MTTDIAKIAAGLTKAQRFWVKSGRQPAGAGKWPVHNALLDKGLAQPFPWRWTPLGQQVRAHLLANKDTPNAE
jgi:hypothetical protein